MISLKNVSKLRRITMRLTPQTLLLALALGACGSENSESELENAVGHQQERRDEAAEQQEAADRAREEHSEPAETPTDDEVTREASEVAVEEGPADEGELLAEEAAEETAAEAAEESGAEVLDEEEEQLVAGAIEEARTANTGASRCDRAYDEAAAAVRHLQERAPERVATAMPSREVFLEACGELPAPAQDCLRVSFATANADECERVQAMVPPAASEAMRRVLAGE